ncbi:hypothetical protein [Natronosalvus halobius]|uniref:hypothetical protein n=1 Tax=Natronosalvus halobius TaxID=2953746 RepID=UPI00209EB8DC|nr:hypothetical protein [Natronosalvus halobius]USZ70893.1 hypothetical protein NGM15_12390 [Natronosalvus halobius]
MVTTTPGRPDGSNLERARPLSLGGLVIVLASVALSAVSYGHLADTVRIRWTIGTYYGPEYAPTLGVLVAFPVALIGLYVGARWLRTWLVRRGAVDEFDEFRLVYDACVLATLGVIVACQFVLVVLNL